MDKIDTDAPEINLDEIIKKIKENVKRRGSFERYNADYLLMLEDDEPKENGLWVKFRKFNRKLKNSRFYFVLFPFVKTIKYLFRSLRYEGNVRVDDLIRLNDEDFIRACYFKMLGRKPDEDGRNSYLVALRSGKTDKISVMISFAGSKEARRRKINVKGLFYYNLRRRIARIPAIGYILRLLYSVLLLPKRLKEISSSIDRILANIDRLYKMQLSLTEKNSSLKSDMNVPEPQDK